MSTSVSRGLRLSSSGLRMEGEAKASERQGIGSILGSDSERPKTTDSLRRTLSADMSSKNWFAQNGFSPLKKTASSEGFSVVSITDPSSSSSSSEGEEEEQTKKEELESEGQFSIWRSSIESEQQKEELERPGLLDIWSSILSQKAEDSSKSSSDSAPYIHPLVKRSKSTLSQKSLEICTESLGSETGSDGFFSYPPSETGDFEENPEEAASKEAEEESQATEEELGHVNYYCSVDKKSPPRSFPPPLTSLSRRDGPCLHMRSHRRDGRLVLEAVPVPSYNYFHAERQGRRLLLSFINDGPFEEPSNFESDEEDIQEEEEEEEEFSEEEDEVVKEEEEEAEEFGEFEGCKEETFEKGERVDGRGVVGKVVSQPSAKLPGGMKNVQRSPILITKLIGLTDNSPTWSHKTKKSVDQEEDDEELTPLPVSLPTLGPTLPRVGRLIPSPVPAVAAAAVAASFNAFEHCWRTKPPPMAAATTMYPLTQPPPPPPPPIFRDNNKFIISKRPQEVFPLLRGCKESRRSQFIWEPSCIATS